MLRFFFFPTIYLYPIRFIASFSLSVSSPPLPLPYSLTYRFTASQRLKSSRFSSEYLDDLCTLIEWFRPKKTNTWRQILRSRGDFHCSLKALKIKISPIFLIKKKHAHIHTHIYIHIIAVKDYFSDNKNLKLNKINMKHYVFRKLHWCVNLYYLYCRVYSMHT